MKTSYTCIASELLGQSVYVWEALGRRRRRGKCREYRLADGGKLEKIDLAYLCFLPSPNPRLLAQVKRMTDEYWPIHERVRLAFKKYVWPRTGTLIPTGAIRDLLYTGFLETDPTRKKP
ncbi:MAG TPA: hypothetical protein PKY77_23560 [Phycisphaerae bacterium]|nr:hypothetical protein [Phycisphaerae bacterium]HRY71021.1 hypothetical protein [Phycisphaerae bacterium]HSA29313.1 hypothetical protein [Phycisphaerae bacterium]